MTFLMLPPKDYLIKDNVPDDFTKAAAVRVVSHSAVAATHKYYENHISFKSYSSSAPKEGSNVRAQARKLI
jgi:hypothetical protein